MNRPHLLVSSFVAAALLVASMLQAYASPGLSRNQGASSPRVALVATRWEGFVAEPNCWGTEVLGSGALFHFKRPQMQGRCTGLRPIPTNTDFVPGVAVYGLVDLANAEGFFTLPHVIGKMVPDTGHQSLRIKIGSREHTVIRYMGGSSADTRRFEKLYYLVWSLATPPPQCDCTG